MATITVVGSHRIFSVTKRAALPKLKLSSELSFMTSQLSGLKISTTHLSSPAKLSVPSKKPLQPVARNFSTPFVFFLCSGVYKVLLSEFVGFYQWELVWYEGYVLFVVWIYGVLLMRACLVRGIRNNQSRD